jgi:hypothetical protein
LVFISSSGTGLIEWELSDRFRDEAFEHIAI